MHVGQCARMLVKKRAHDYSPHLGKEVRDLRSFAEYAVRVPERGGAAADEPGHLGGLLVGGPAAR